MMKRFTLIALVLVASFGSLMAQRGNSIVPVSRTYGSPNLKLFPAFHLNTFGLAYEQPISDRLSLELMAGYKLPITKPEGAVPKNDAYKAGFLVDLTARYYTGTAPEGWYFSAMVGASNILYPDGNVRPFSINNMQAQTPLTATGAKAISNPEVLRYAIGAGYQIKMVSRRLVANIGVSFGGYSNDMGTQYQLSLTPTIGYSF